MKALLISYDNDSFIHSFPLGLAYVASALRKHGAQVEIYSQDLYHYPEAHLTEHIKRNHYDVVGVGMCGGYYQYRKLLKISQAIPKGVEYWVGGHLVSPEPEYFKRITKATWVCKGEYDYTEDLDSLPYPAWELFPVDYYALMRLPHAENSDRCFPVLSGRGCPYQCNFCYRMHEGYRPRSVKNIVEEIQILMRDYYINYIDFADELLMVSPERTVEIAEALRPLGIKWICNGRLNCAKPKVLKAMKESGCTFINYGIEAIDNEVLRKMNKKLNVRQITEGIENTLAVGISPGFNFIWGNIGDTSQTLTKAVQFLLKYDDHAQLRTIRPVTPYPGCDLYYYAMEKGLLKGCADFYESKHINSDLLSVNFTELTDEQFYRCLYQANKALLRNHYFYLMTEMEDRAKKLYFEKDASFRGFRQT